MKREHLIVQLPEKCEEDWDKMTPVDQGRLCDVCDKCVVDFKPMTDSEIFKYFKERKDQSVCGQFSTSQLNRKIQSSFERKNSFPKYKLAASIFLGGLALLPKMTKAQERPVLQVQDDLAANGSRQVLISGRVTDNEGKAMGNTELSLDCGDTVLTDTLGNYVYEYIGTQNSLSIAVLDSAGDVFQTQLSLSHLAIGNCSDLVKDVAIIESATKDSIDLPFEHDMVYGGAPVFNVVREPLWYGIKDTLSNMLDSVVQIIPKASSITPEKDEIEDVKGLRKLLQRLKLSAKPKFNERKEFLVPIKQLKELKTELAPSTEKPQGSKKEGDRSTTPIEAVLTNSRTREGAENPD